MNALLPLIAMWALNTRQQGAVPPAAPSVPSPPPWPTPLSPPPPMPAFKPTPTPSADPSGPATPLADLHNKPPKVQPARATQPANLKAQAASKAKSAAMDLLRGKLRTSAQAPLVPIDPWASPTTSVPVAKLQEIVNARGGRLVRDGLYGPKTAAAWQKLAKSKGLAGTIARVGPNTAKVVSRTYESLAVPPIP